MTQPANRRWATALSGLAALLVLALAALLVFETVALGSGDTPITAYVRYEVQSRPATWWTATNVISFALGALIAHFGWR